MGQDTIDETTVAAKPLAARCELWKRRAHEALGEVKSTSSDGQKINISVLLGMIRSYLMRKHKGELWYPSKATLRIYLLEQLETNRVRRKKI